MVIIGRHLEKEDEMGTGLLATIDSPDDVKRLTAEQRVALCDEIRNALLTYGHRHGGHIGSNLAVVEATVALHTVFDSPRDRIVFDVSHQSYVHKMLTGRRRAFADPDLFGTVTGFTNPNESEHDSFVLGHTGTSISLACGLAKTRDMNGGLTTTSRIGNVVAMIGDGSLSSGIAFEGLNNAAEQGGNLIIIVNDNEMSIAGDFGGMYGPLARLRASNGTAETNIFKAFGLDYRYVEAGNDVNALVEAFSEVRNIDHPVVVHIHTLKGLGFEHRQTEAHNTGHREPWHSDHCTLADIHIHEGQCEASHWQKPDRELNAPANPRAYYGAIVMNALERRFAAEPGLTIISPATPGSNGISHEFRERAGSHYVDTGITESHAVAFAAGIAKAGGTPIVATTASFFQRAYDQFFQEMSLNRARVTILDFLGGLSSSDNTHSGAYDIAMFANIPGITMLCPTSEEALLADVTWATSPAGTPGCPDGPVVIRMPGDPILAAERDGVLTKLDGGVHDATSGSPLSYRTVRKGGRTAILALGNTYPLGLDIADRIGATLVDPRQCSSLDEGALESLRDGHELVVTLEDGQLEGGWGEKVTAYYANHRAAGHADHAVCGSPRVLNVGADKEFTDRVRLTDLNERYGLTSDAIVARINEALRH